MSAHRRRSLRRPPVLPDPAEAVDLWWQAVEIRTEWLGHALSGAPAERAVAEDAITGLYALLGRSRPAFVWVDSPAAAARALPPPAIHAADGTWPLESRLASLLSTLRQRLDQRIDREQLTPWRIDSRPDMLDRLRSGSTLLSVLDAGVRDVLRRVVRESVAGLIKAATPGGLGVFWYGQQEADWVACYDVHHRVRRIRYAAADLAQLELWATLVRSCGWWWPRDDVCVVAERPCTVRTEPVPGSPNGERRPHDENGPAVVFPDGWAVYAWHGTPVPSWVIDSPTPELIVAEPNVEVRRCAVEHLGWTTFIERAGLTLVAQAPDPGNPGCALRLYDLPYRQGGAPTRLLLAVNGSAERDGTRRRYGLHVPPWFDDPVAAAAWSYGLSAPQYALLERRT